MKKEATINTPELSIVGNAMAWKNSVIFLSNISSISTIPLESLPFPLWALGISVAGLICLIGIDDFALIGACLLLFGGFFIASWYLKNNDLKSQRKLIILTNAGVTYSFVFNNMAFLDQVYAVLISLIAENKKEVSKIKINIQNSQISGNARVLNDLIFR